MIKNGFVTVKKIKIRQQKSILGPPYIEESEHEILIYSDKIKPYIYNVKKGESFLQFDSFLGMAVIGKEFRIKLATRKLESIDYVNEREDPVAGKILDIGFSYSLKKDFPCLEELIEATSFLSNLKLDKTYRGKALVCSGTKYGRWELSGIYLEDKNPTPFRDETIKDTIHNKIKIDSIIGKYSIENIKDYDNFFEFRSDGTCIVNSSGRWKIKENLIQIASFWGDKSKIEEGILSEDNIMVFKIARLIKNNGGKQIRKSGNWVLWDKYSLYEWEDTGNSYPTGYIEFKNDGKVIFTYFGEWDIDSKEESIITIKLENGSFRGKIDGNKIIVESFGTLIKQEPEKWGSTILRIIILILKCLIILFAIILVVIIINKTIIKRRAISNTVYCAQCGKENLETAKFCTNCGGKL
ncbi:MAG TPA: zinc ribbon domain-containing protein [Candidatus Hydrogenedens sp.]|nr:zinc ribbon domain-containing protein [Candidatus Hydrogenedens sp.]